VIVGGVAIYTVYRSAQCTEKERCPSCGRILPEQKEGEPKLETCPFCLEPLPQDQTNQVHVAFSTGPWTNFTTVIQMSETCGSNWADIVELPNYVFNGGLEIISLPDHAAFEAWLAENGLVANRHIMTTNSLPKGSALFRLVERDRDNP
jgi:hypothetical protein